MVPGSGTYPLAVGVPCVAAGLRSLTVTRGLPVGIGGFLPVEQRYRLRRVAVRTWDDGRVASHLRLTFPLSHGYESQETYMTM